MNIIDDIKNRARGLNKRIALIEIEDDRIIQAASICQKENIAQIVLIGNKNEVSSNYDLDGVEFIDPNTYEKDLLIEQLYNLRKDKGLSIEEASNLINNNKMYFAIMLLYNNVIDGIVAGARLTSKETLKPALQIIKTNSNSSLASAFFLMQVPNCNYGSNGVFVFADAGLNQNPDSNQLANIAYDSSNSFELLTNEKANVALLSHSTKGSANHESVDKVIAALNIAKNNYSQLNIDGELQLDAAIDMDVAKIKSPNSTVAGRANVLVFPNLDAANIGYKLVERLANAQAYGPIIQGLNKVVNDLSRGCSANDIVGVIAISVIQANK